MLFLGFSSVKVFIFFKVTLNDKHLQKYVQASSRYKFALMRGFRVKFNIIRMNMQL